MKFNFITKLKIVLITGLLLSVTSIHAKGYLTSLNGSDVVITKVFNHGSGAVTLYISGTILNPDNCSGTTIVHLKGDLPGHEHMIASALTAFTAGKKVGLYSQGCEIIPFWGGVHTRPIINNLWISN